MVWVTSKYLVMSKKKSKRFIKIDSILKSKKYITLLRFHLLPDIAEGEIYHGACSYTLGATNKFLSDKNIAVLKRFVCMPKALTIT